MRKRGKLLDDYDSWSRGRFPLEYWFNYGESGYLLLGARAPSPALSAQREDFVAEDLPGI